MFRRKAPNPQTCEKCPYRYTKKGCPAWLALEYGFMEMNPQTGQERLVSGCFYQLWPRLMIHVVRAADHSSAAVTSFRNELISGFTQLSLAAKEAIEQAHRPALEDKRDGPE